MQKIQFDLLVTKLSADQLDDADMAIIESAGVMFGVFDQNSARQAKAMDTVAQAVRDGTLAIEDMGKAADAIAHGYTLDLFIKAHGDASVISNLLEDKIKNTVGSGKKYATGTGGWMTVPSGYPNDSYPVWMSSGEQFAVTPAGVNAPTPTGGGNAGGNVSIQLVISSPMTILDQQMAQQTLLPLLINGYREAKARGAI